MIQSFIRKARQLISDPVLCRWLFERALGRSPNIPAHIPNRPPYLDELPELRLGRHQLPTNIGIVGRSQDLAPFNLSLPGASLEIDVTDIPTIFTKKFPDTESLLALHRFAWLPLIEPAPGWVEILWNEWCKQFGIPSLGWEWHPYTAAERVINIIDFISRAGFPGDPNQTMTVLARHASAIAENLEYYGEHYTSNHLSNNGRGLYRLGLFLGWDDCADLGAKILIHEANRIFTPLGILREGSSHYHMLLTRNYLDAWLAACRHRRAEEFELRRIASAALIAGRLFQLPGGVPLIGDISPDCPPKYLACLHAGDGGWLRILNPEDRDRIVRQRDATAPPDNRGFIADGWLRYASGAWTGLWHVSPYGWSSMPGHGHQDCGSFEMHFEDEPLFVDLGRGAYGETGEAARYRSAAAHNTLRVNANDPYPSNRPYYDAAFRQRIGGPPPELLTSSTGVYVAHSGFGRIGAGKAVRNWSFEGKSFRIEDRLSGRGSFVVERRLHTTLPVVIENCRAIIKGQQATYCVDFGDPLFCEPMTRWTAYGQGVPATALIAIRRHDLPYTGLISVEVH